MKETVCPKKKFPYGEAPDFYDPTCIVDHKKCKEICGKKCQQKCKHEGCSRGKLTSQFLYCPSREVNEEENLPYIEFKYVKETNVKEGKNPYNRMEKVVTDLNLDGFLTRFRSDFPKYSEHQIVCWFLSNTKQVAFSKSYMSRHIMSQTGDFAQNLLHIKKHETAEEYFKRKQTTLHVLVVGITTPIRTETGETEGVAHQMTQFTSSDDRLIFNQII